MSSEWGLIVALVLPAVAGYLWLRLWPVVMGELLRCVGGVVLGHGVLSWAMYVLNAAGVPLRMGPWMATVVVLAVLPALLLWRRGRRREPVVPEVGTVPVAWWRLDWRVAAAGVMTLGIGLVVVNLVNQGMGEALSTYPEVGIWGYKAKVFWLDGDIAREFLADPSRSHMHPTYPLGLPLMVAWCYGWMGGVADVDIRALPTLLTVITLAVVAGTAQRRAPWWLALAAALAWASGRNLVEVGYQLYADMWLIAAAVPGVVLAAEAIGEEDRAARCWQLALAGMFLGCAGWIKNEGVLVAVIVTGLVLVLRRPAEWRPRRMAGDLVALLLPILLIAGPWQVHRQFLDLGFRDFGGPAGDAAERQYGRLQVVLGRVGYLLFKSPTANGVVGWLAALMILVGGRRLWLNRRRMLVLATALALIMAYSLAIAGSSLSVTWHLVAMPRILLLPMALLVLLAVDLMGTDAEDVALHRTAEPSLAESETTFRENAGQSNS